MNDPTLVLQLGVLHKGRHGWHLTRWEKLPATLSIPMAQRYRCGKCGRGKRVALW